MVCERSGTQNIIQRLNASDPLPRSSVFTLDCLSAGQNHSNKGALQFVPDFISADKKKKEEKIEFEDKTNLSAVLPVLCAVTRLKVVQRLQLGRTEGQEFTLAAEESSKSNPGGVVSIDVVRRRGPRCPDQPNRPSCQNLHLAPATTVPPLPGDGENIRQIEAYCLDVLPGGLSPAGLHVFPASERMS